MKLIQFIALLFTALMAASFFVPVVGGIFWKRATREGAIAAMIGATATAFWELLGPENIDPVVPGFLASAVLMFAVSMMTKPPPASALEPYFPDR